MLDRGNQSCPRIFEIFSIGHKRTEWKIYLIQGNHISISGALRLLTVGQNLMDEMFIHTYDYSVLINHFLQMVLLSSCGSVNSTTVLRKHLEQMCTLLRICYILSKPKTFMLISILFTICKNIFYFFWKKKYSIEVNIFCLRWTIMRYINYM